MIWLGIAAGAAGCYLAKLAGLSLPRRVLDDPRGRRVVTLIPVALLAALAATQTFADGQRLAVDARILGLITAIVAVWRRAPFLVVVVSAAAVTAGARWLASTGWP